MSEGLLNGGGRELVLDDLGGGGHVRDSARGKSESVVGTKESSHEGLTLRLVDLAGTVVVVFLPEVVEVSSDVGVNLILLHDVKLANNISSPRGTGVLGELPDASAGTDGVSLLDSVESLHEAMQVHLSSLILSHTERSLQVAQKIKLCKNTREEVVILQMQT